jgi:hypothetical protein
MKPFILTVVSVVIGIAINFIGYIRHISTNQQTLLIIAAGIVILSIALYERNKAVKRDKEISDNAIFNILVVEMKELIWNFTNRPDGDKSIKAKAISKRFSHYDKVIMYKAIAHVLKVPVDKVDDLIENKPEEWTTVDGLLRLNNK